MDTPGTEELPKTPLTKLLSDLEAANEYLKAANEEAQRKVQTLVGRNAELGRRGEHDAEYQAELEAIKEHYSQVLPRVLCCSTQVLPPSRIEQILEHALLDADIAQGMARDATTADDKPESGSGLGHTSNATTTNHEQ